MEIIRKGKYYQIYTMYISGVKLYFVSSIKSNDLVSTGNDWSYLNEKQTIEIFEYVEKNWLRDK